MFDGQPNGGWRKLTLPVGLSLSNQACSMFFVGVPLASYQSSSFGELGSASPNILDMCMATTSQRGLVLMMAPVLKTLEIGTEPRAAIQVCFGLTSGASNITYYVDNLPGVTSAAVGSLLR